MSALTGGKAGVAKCAILFAAPVSWEEFERAAAPAAGSDYLAGMLRERDAASTWAIDYEPVALAAQRLMKTAAELGAFVRAAATLENFAEATARYDVVVVLAHWRGAIFRSSDFSGGVDAIRARMQRSAVLRNVKTADSGAQALADALNAAIGSGVLLDGLPEDLAGMAKRSRVIGQTLSRDLVEEELSGLVMPGNQLELADGLRSPAEIEDAIAIGFCGVLDLAMCNSEALGTYLDLARGNVIRHVHWPDYLHPLPPLLKVEKTLQLMAAWGGDYIETRLGLEEEEARVTK